MINLTLPWPPSVNTYWRHPTTGRLAGRHLISEKGRAYREVVSGMLQDQSLTAGIATAVKLEIEAFAPDKRRRDLDNILKAMLDGLVYGGLLSDDDQVHDLRIYWVKDADGNKKIGGMVKVRITDLPDTPNG
jgi:crossover junction endodeoxyribonuclease RusA